MMESRRLAARGQVPPLAGPRQRSGPRRTCRVRSGWSGDCVHGTVRPAPDVPPLRPLQGLRARFAVHLDPPRAKRLGVPISRITHPVYPPCYTRPCTRLGPHTDDPSSRMHHTDVAGTTGACTYDTFGPAVGEPRGIEHSLYFRVLAVFSTDCFSAVLHLIMTETGVLRTHSSEACGRSIWRSILRSFWRSIWRSI